MYKDDLLVGKNAECTLKGDPTLYCLIPFLSIVTFRSKKVQLSWKCNW